MITSHLPHQLRSSKTREDGEGMYSTGTALGTVRFRIGGVKALSKACSKNKVFILRRGTITAGSRSRREYVLEYWGEVIPVRQKRRLRHEDKRGTAWAKGNKGHEEDRRPQGPKSDGKELWGRDNGKETCVRV